MQQLPTNPPRSVTSDKYVQSESDELVLDGTPLPINGSVQKQDLARFQSKVTMGDYSFDSDPLLSAYNISSLTGGMGNEHLKEGVDDETYWTGTLETRWPGQITLLPYTWEIPGPVGSGEAYPLADYPSHAPSFWAVFGTSIARWNPIQREFGPVSLLPTPPVGKAVEFGNLLYIPLGEQGYATMDELGDTDVFSLPVKAFSLWDNKIAALCTDGQLRIGSEGQPWEAESPNLKLPSAAVPRGLCVFVNQQGAPTLYIITNIGVWAYGRDEDYLYMTQLQYPPHPDQGNASANWRGEAMYVNVGLGVHSYNGGIVGAMGPDGRYGLPAHLRGTIVDLVPEYNSLLALIRGERLVDPDEQQSFEIVDPFFQQNTRPFVERNAHAALLRWNGSSWHPAWQAPTPEGIPTWAFVSRADNQYNLWWGYAGKMYYQKLPYAFHNPKQGLRAGINEFASSGDLWTGWMDADMPAFWKLLSHVEVLLDDPTESRRPMGKVEVYYQYDNDPGLYYLGEATKIGMTPLPFNVDESEGHTGFSWGLPTKRIRFMVRMSSDNIHESPVLRSLLLKFLKVPISQLSFAFTVDLTQSEQFKAYGVGELAEFIRERASSHQFSELIHRGNAYRVRISQSRANDQTGYDLRSSMEVSAVEVVMPLPDWVEEHTSIAAASDVVVP